MESYNIYSFLLLPVFTQHKFEIHSLLWMNHSSFLFIVYFYLLFKQNHSSFLFIPEKYPIVFVAVQSLSHVWLFVTLWTIAGQVPLSFTISLLKLMSIESVILSNHSILSPPFPPALNLSQHQGLFQWVSSSHQVAKVLELQVQHQTFQWIFRVDFL